MLTKLTGLPRTAKTGILAFVDAGIGVVAFWAAVLARVGAMPAIPVQHVIAASAAVIAVVPSIGLVCGLYRPVVRFQIPRLSLHAAMVALICGATFAALSWTGGADYGRSLGLGTVLALMLFALLVLSRHAARWLLHSAPERSGMRVAVFGAGIAGRQVVATMKAGRKYVPVLFIDDDVSLRGRNVEGLPVVSFRDLNLRKQLAAKEVEQIFLAVPSATPSVRRRILERLSAFPAVLRTVPGSRDWFDGDAEVLENSREIAVEELLGRDSIAPISHLLEECIRGKVILVTGGGGSIGSELCRQALHLSPRSMVVLDHSELALYQIERDLRTIQTRLAQSAELHFILGSVNDAAMVQGVFEKFCIDTVYHAAAYKHVPIVEENVVQGFKNNVLGTWRLGQLAAQATVRHFILVSSDKAVRPTNVMGATKRMAELVVQMFAERYPTTIFTMVRFGNVLGSSGSVIPLFRSQIQSGGPITVTHPEVTRYFMTINEAVQLVIQAGAMACGAEVFLLDMGQPVKIIDLAKRMAHLTGKSVRDTQNPDGEIAIEIVGLRPGEKLFEELLISGGAAVTAHPRIWTVSEESADANALESDINIVDRLIRENTATPEDVIQLLVRWVVGYAKEVPPVQSASADHIAMKLAAIGQ